MAKKKIRTFLHCKECKMLTKDEYCPICKKKLSEDTELTLWEK